jgi:hypothetical protein
MGATANRASAILLLSAAFGALVLHTGMIKVKSPVPPTLSSIASTQALKIGDAMPEGHEHAGWIYGGVSKTTGKPFYIAPKDSGVMQWKEAMDFAARSNMSLPSREELNQMYQARNEGALKDTFNRTGSDPAGWYWSSSQDYGYGAWAQRFSDGHKSYGYKFDATSLRCVRR